MTLRIFQKFCFGFVACGFIGFPTLFAQESQKPDSLFRLCTESILESADAVASCKAFLSLQNKSERDHIIALRARAAANVQSGQPDRAIEDLNEAIKLKPDDPALYVDRGDISGSLGRANAALEDYSTAITIDDRFSRAYYSRGVLNRALGKLDAAQSDLTRTIELDGNLSAAHYYRGLIELENGNRDLARQDFDGAIENALFTFAEAHIQRALLLSDTGDISHAVSDLTIAYENGSPNLVRQFQMAATETGHYEGEASGTFDDQTKVALAPCLLDIACKSKLTL